MSTHTGKGFGQSDPHLTKWSELVYKPKDAALDEIIRRSAAAGLPDIAVSSFDGLHLEVLVRASAAKKVVEIGTLGGYSGVCILRALPADGFLHTFEYSGKHAKVAQETFEKNGVASRVKIHVGPAAENLPKINLDGPFDVVFLDADKGGYPGYLAWAEENLRVGGVVLADNAFGWGGVAREDDAGHPRDQIAALRTFNERLAQGGRFRATMLPTAEGLAMGVKIR